MSDRARASTLFYLPDAIVPWPAQSVRWAIDFTLGFFGGRVAPARRGRAAARHRPAARRDDRQPVEGPAQARAARDRPADAAADAAGRRAVRRPRPAPEPRRRADAALLRVRRPDDVPVDPSDQGRGARLRSLRPAQRRRDPRRRHVRASSPRRPRRAARRPAISKRCSLRSRRGPRRARDRERSRSGSRSVVAGSRRNGASWSRRARGGCCSLAMGPLVGVSFISAVRTYAEVSGLNGTAAGVGEAFSPLIGIWAPTFSACELAAVFLLPFVAIRLVSGDRQSGALKLEMQQPMPAFARIAAKALVLLGGWLIASLAAARRRRCSGRATAAASIAPELATVVARPRAQRRPDDRARRRGRGAHRASVDGRDPHAERHGRHLDRQLRRGGPGRHLGARSPATRRRRWSPQFQHGLIRLDVVLVALALVIAAVSAFAAIWMRLGVAVRRRRAGIGRARGGRRAGGGLAAALATAELGPVGEPR